MLADRKYAAGSEMILQAEKNYDLKSNMRENNGICLQIKSLSLVTYKIICDWKNSTNIMC